MHREFKSALLTLMVIVISGFSHMANSIEEPRYQLIQALDDVEIRQYEPAIQAVTILPGSSSTSEGFRRLAGFIFGGNEREQKIAMTAPVQETLGEERPTMAFTMPAQYSFGELPAPTDDRVTLQDVPARTVAVVSFSGWATRSKVERYERQLREALKLNAIATVGNSSLNQYNPPWTLPFLRRNEIMIEVNLPLVSTR
jgi:SOUL heme-binding protein